MAYWLGHPQIVTMHCGRHLYILLVGTKDTCGVLPPSSFNEKSRQLGSRQAEGTTLGNSHVVYLYISNIKVPKYVLDTQKKHGSPLSNTPACETMHTWIIK